MGFAIPLDVKHVGLAAHLAVFDVGLARATGFVDGGLNPFIACGTLEMGWVHFESVRYSAMFP